MDALRDLMAREIGKLEPKPAPAQPATVTPPHPTARLDTRPSPKPETPPHAQPQLARREAKIDPIARAKLDKLMAGEIARVEQASPRPAPVSAASAPAPAAVAPPPAAARPASVPAPLARVASPPPAAPRPSWSKLAWPTAAPARAPATPPARATSPSVPEPVPAPVVQAAPVQPEPAPEPAPAEDVKPSVPPALAALFEARAVPGGQGVFARQTIAKGTRLFGEDDWADEDERKSFSSLSPQQFEELKPTLRAVFLRYAYNTSPEQITGAFRPELVRDPINFINHSCDPNAGYDGAGNIVALRSIAADEEIRMDYGTFTFSFDHEFTCGCQALWCRGKVMAKDWPELVRTGLRLPAFMRQQANKALWG